MRSLPTTVAMAEGSAPGTRSLNCEEIKRYGRQLILPEWGVKAQSLIKESSVLIVGMGGLGSPATLYLAAAGVGHLGLVDEDVIETSNLHRQVIHTERAQGTSKVESAKQSVNRINSIVKCSTYELRLDKDNAMAIVAGFDVVLDCTDNVATRYLLNDVCVLLDKPLVSGSALRFEGQLTVYHHGDQGPCYRCIFPEPPPQGTVTNCSDGGVMGPVPGMIGTMQAMEALKISSRTGSVLCGRMVLYDGYSASFRTIKLRPRQQDCVVCGVSPCVTCPQNYDSWCSSCAPLSVLAEEDRVTCSQYKAVQKQGRTHLLVDVREKGEFEICHLENAINIPLKALQGTEACVQLKQLLSPFTRAPGLVQVYVCCRRGNDSQLAVLALRSYLKDFLQDEKINESLKIEVKDIVGGLLEWTESVDPSFPKY